jgi:hypothetical protein
MNAKGMISAHPDVKGNISEALVRCIDECADACLA